MIAPSGNLMRGTVVTSEVFTREGPPVPRPYFESYEAPVRVGSIVRDWLGRFPDGGETNWVWDATPAADSDVLRVHSHFLLELVKRLSEAGSGEIGNGVLATPATLDLAKQAAGCCVEGLRIALERRSASPVACVVRPPGHHASPGASEGLCVFNNVAVAIRAAIASDLASRFAVLDVDAHYGDGIAHVFYEDPEVLYASIHEMDFDQGEKGTPAERGRGKGKNYTVNFPVPLFSNDDDYLRAFTKLAPVLEQFNPDALVVAAGLDGHWADPIGNLSLTTRGFRAIGLEVEKLVRATSAPVVYCLEGGYNPLALPACLQALAFPSSRPDPWPEAAEPSFPPDEERERLLRHVEREFERAQGRAWKLPARS
ncbi:MAG: hypothetical protein Kow0069_22230 [Promethearchaeota archaeon]